MKTSLDKRAEAVQDRGIAPTKKNPAAVALGRLGWKSGKVRRLGEIVTGKFAGFGPERIRLAELFDDVVQDYRDNDKDTLINLQGRLKNHLMPFFWRDSGSGFQHSPSEALYCPAPGRTCW